MAAWADSITSKFPSGLSSIKLMYPGDDAYYPIPIASVNNTRVSLTPYASEDGRKRPGKTYARKLSIEFTTNACSVTKLIKVLPYMRAVLVKAVLNNGVTISTGLLTSGSSQYMAVDWEYALPTDMSKDQTVKFVLTMDVLDTELTTMLGTPPADGTPDGGADIFYPMLLLSALDTVCGGMSKVELKETTAGTWVADSLTMIQGMMTMKSLPGQADGKGRQFPFAVDVSLEITSMQNSSAELTRILDTLDVQTNDIRITTNSGSLVTFNDLLGITIDPQNDGDIDKDALIKLTAKGTILLSEFNGVWP